MGEVKERWNKKVATITVTVKGIPITRIPSVECAWQVAHVSEVTLRRIKPILRTKEVIRIEFE